MLGNRDSEVAMLIEDTEMVPSYLDGKEVSSAIFGSLPSTALTVCYSTRRPSLPIR